MLNDCCCCFQFARLNASRSHWIAVVVLHTHASFFRPIYLLPNVNKGIIAKQISHLDVHCWVRKEETHVIITNDVSIKKVSSYWYMLPSFRRILHFSLQLCQYDAASYRSYLY